MQWKYFLIQWKTVLIQWNINKILFIAMDIFKYNETILSFWLSAVSEAGYPYFIINKSFKYMSNSHCF